LSESDTKFVPRIRNTLILGLGLANEDRRDRILNRLSLARRHGVILSH
jgi:hypothetical protein